MSARAARHTPNFRMMFPPCRDPEHTCSLEDHPRAASLPVEHRRHRDREAVGELGIVVVRPQAIHGLLALALTLLWSGCFTFRAQIPGADLLVRFGYRTDA